MSLPPPFKSMHPDSIRISENIKSCLNFFDNEFKNLLSIYKNLNKKYLLATDFRNNLDMRASDLSNINRILKYYYEMISIDNRDRVLVIYELMYDLENRKIRKTC